MRGYMLSVMLVHVEVQGGDLESSVQKSLQMLKDRVIGTLLTTTIGDDIEHGRMKLA